MGEKKKKKGERGSAPGSSAKKLTCKRRLRPHFCGRSPPAPPPASLRAYRATGPPERPAARDPPPSRQPEPRPRGRPSPARLRSARRTSPAAPRAVRGTRSGEARRPQGARAAAATNGSRSRRPGTNSRPPAHGHYPRRCRHHARAACAPAAALLPTIPPRLPPSRGRYGGSPLSLPRPLPDLGMVRRSPDPLLWCGSCGAGCCRANHTSSSFSVPSKKCAPFSFMVRQLGNQQPQKLTATPPPPPGSRSVSGGLHLLGLLWLFFFFQY